jgi:hypothetical protein
VEHVQDTAPGRGTHASECIAGARARQFVGSMKSRAWWHAGSAWGTCQCEVCRLVCAMQCMQSSAEGLRECRVWGGESPVLVAVAAPSTHILCTLPFTCQITCKQHIPAVQAWLTAWQANSGMLQCRLMSWHVNSGPDLSSPEKCKTFMSPPERASHPCIRVAKE